MSYLYYVAAMIREWKIITNVNVECYEHDVLSVTFRYMEAI